MLQFLLPLVPSLIGLGSSLIGNKNQRSSQIRQKSMLDEIGPILEKYYKSAESHNLPYEKAGETALSSLAPQYERLLRDPESFINELGAKHRSSEGYKYKVKEAIDASNKASAAGGMLGSPAQKKLLANDVAGFADQDMYNYITNALGLYAQGLAGNRDLAHLGQNSATNMSELAQRFGSALASNQLNKAKMEEAQNYNRNLGIGETFGHIGNILGTEQNGLLKTLFDKIGVKNPIVQDSEFINYNPSGYSPMQYRSPFQTGISANYGNFYAPRDNYTSGNAFDSFSKPRSYSSIFR